MAEFDLTKINCQFLDRHLTFPLLEFLCGKEVSVTGFIEFVKFLPSTNSNYIYCVCLLFKDIRSKGITGVYFGDCK